MGFIKKNGRKTGETETAEKMEYQFLEDAELKECRYCRVMIPKTAKICPNCKKHLKKNWLGIVCLLCVLAVCGAGIYYYSAVYSVTEQASAAVNMPSGEAVWDVEDGRIPEGVSATEEAATETDAVVQIENLPEIPAALEGTKAESEAVKADGPEEGAGAGNGDDPEKASGAGKEDDPEKASEAGKADNSEEGAGADKEDDPEKASEAGKEDDPEEGAGADKEDDPEKASETGKADNSEEGAGADKEDDPEKTSEAGKEDDFREKSGTGKKEEEDFAGMMAGAGMEAGSDTETENGDNTIDGAVEVTDIHGYTEEEFRDICQQTDYRKLLRRQESYLNAAVTEELTVMEQVDGGLFDENIYYLCKREDEQGITRYYIIRDDREEDTSPILEGDVLRVYGQLFGSCKIPGYLVKTQPTVPALTMVYYDLMEE